MNPSEILNFFNIISQNKNLYSLFKPRYFFLKDISSEFFYQVIENHFHLVILYC